MAKRYRREIDLEKEVKNIRILIYSKFPEAEGKLICEAKPFGLVVNIKKSIQHGLSDQLAAKIKMEFPQHVV